MEKIKIHINNKSVFVNKGIYLLDALQANGINIPTLCNLPNLNPTGACRLCIVEIENTQKLVPSCSTIVEEGMSVLTHSPRVVKTRQTLVELILSNHPDDCLYCSSINNCELLKITKELNIKQRTFKGNKKYAKTDRSSQGIVHDSSKCILCDRCVRVCKDIANTYAIEHMYRGPDSRISTVFNRGLYYSNCIQCGNCLKVCPTGALSEKSFINQISNHFADNKSDTIAIISTSTIISIAEKYNIKNIKKAESYIIAALKELGFSYVIPEAFGNDIYIKTICKEIEKNIENNFKVILSDCTVIELFLQAKFPDAVKHLINIKSPQQILGKITRDILNLKNRPIIVSIMPCISRKNEALDTKNLTKGLPDIDYVISTEELTKLFNIRGISFPFPKSENYSKPFSDYSSAGAQMQINYGITDSIYECLKVELNSNKNDIKNIVIDNLKAKKYNLNKQYFNAISLSGLNIINNNLSQALSSNDINIIELHSCENSCISGSITTKPSYNNLNKLLKEAIKQNPSKTYHQNIFISTLEKKGMINSKDFGTINIQTEDKNG